MSEFVDYSNNSPFNFNPFGAVICIIITVIICCIVTHCTSWN